jgi:hypothetical protein
METVWNLYNLRTKTTGEPIKLGNQYSNNQNGLTISIDVLTVIFRILPAYPLIPALTVNTHRVRATGEGTAIVSAKTKGFCKLSYSATLLKYFD